MATSYETAPIATDMFTRSMLEPFAEKDRRGILFSRLFGNPRYFTENDTTDIHIQRGSGQQAPLVVRGNHTEVGTGREVAVNKGWTEISRTFPLIEKHSTLAASQLTKRVFGEAIYSMMTKQQRARRLAADLMVQHEDSVVMTCEYLASESIINGKMPKLESETYATATYDFLRADTGKKTFAADWATTTTDHDADIDAGCDFVIQTGNGRPDVMLIGDTKYAEWKDGDQFKELANHRHVVNIRADFDVSAPANLAWMEEAGANFQFMYKTGKGRKLAVFTYDHERVDIDGNTYRYLGNDQMVIFDSTARRDVVWGPNDYMDMDSIDMQLYMDVFGMDIEALLATGDFMSRPNLPTGFPFGGFYYDAYKTGNDKKGVELRVQAAPIYVPVATDTICTTKESW